MTDLHTSHSVTRIRLDTGCTHLQQAQTTQLSMGYMFTPQKAQTSTQQSTFFSATPLSQTKAQQITRRAQTPGLTSLLDFPYQLSLPQEPALHNPWPWQAPQSLSQDDAPQKLYGFILHLPASRGCPREMPLNLRHITESTFLKFSRVTTSIDRSGKPAASFPTARSRFPPHWSAWT